MNSSNNSNFQTDNSKQHYNTTNQNPVLNRTPLQPKSVNKNYMISSSNKNGDKPLTTTPNKNIYIKEKQISNIEEIEENCKYIIKIIYKFIKLRIGLVLK